MAAECGALRLPTGNKYQQALQPRPPALAHAYPSLHHLRTRLRLSRSLLACLAASRGVSLSSFCLQHFKPCVAICLCPSSPPPSPLPLPLCVYRRVCCSCCCQSVEKRLPINDEISAKAKAKAKAATLHAFNDEERNEGGGGECSAQSIEQWRRV